MESEEENIEITSSVLHWNYRNLKYFPPHLLKCSHIIKDIYLKENRINKVPNEIGRLDRLESLQLSGNDIDHIPREIGRLKCLKYLDLSGNLLTALPDELGELLTLRTLILDDNQLTTLPLRLQDLPQLHYLTVYDNRLSRLPQRLVYNPRHCELRVWRNQTLRCLPFGLWFHMFREQRVPCFSIGYGCLDFNNIFQNDCSFKMQPPKPEPSEWRIVLSAEEAVRLVGYRCVLSPYESSTSPAPLSELCLRFVYKTLSERSAVNRRKLSSEPFSYGESWTRHHSYCNRNHQTADRNNNNDIMSTHPNSTDLTELCQCSCTFETTTSKLLERYLNCLPPSIKRDLQNGPISRCENITCKSPVFDFAYLQFYMGSLELLESCMPVLLSGVFCSKRCAFAQLPAAPPLLSWRWRHQNMS